MNINSNQIILLQIIKEGNPDGTYVTVYDIQDALVTLAGESKARDAILHLIKPLVDNGYVERKDGPPSTKGGRGFRTFCVTEKAEELL